LVARWLRGLIARGTAVRKVRRHRSPLIGISRSGGRFLDPNVLPVRTARLTLDAHVCSREELQGRDPVALASWKQDGIRIKTARLTNRRGAKTHGIAIKAQFRLRDDPASWIEDRIKVAIDRPVNFHANAGPGPRSAACAEPMPAPANKAVEQSQARPPAHEFRHHEFRHKCFRHGHYLRQNRPCHGWC
jgi:hypothetical protein